MSWSNGLDVVCPSWVRCMQWRWHLSHASYLFRSLPVPITKQFLSKFQSEITRFVWGNKRYRCPTKTLLRLKSQGSLGLPDLWGYYQAAQLSQISMVFSRGPKPDWLSMEREAVPLNTIDYLLWSDPKRRPAIMAPTLSHSVALCSKLFIQHSLISPLKPLAHPFNNPNFPPGLIL